LCRPDHRVKRDVILPKEVVDTGGRIVPPRLPRFRLPTGVRPLNRRRQVTNDVLEPDVETLRAPIWERYGAAPVEIAGDGTPLQTTANIAAREIEDAGPPMMRMLVQVAQQAVGKGRQGQKPMLSLA